MCVQDPSEGGLKWEDNSDDPIPLGLDIDINNKTYLNWVSEYKRQGLVRMKFLSK